MSLPENLCPECGRAMIDEGDRWRCPEGAPSFLKIGPPPIALLPTPADHRTRALEAVLLFHAGTLWDAEAQARWERLTGGKHPTTRGLCDTVRAALAERPPCLREVEALRAGVHLVIRWLEETHAQDGDEGAIRLLNMLRGLVPPAGAGEPFAYICARCEAPYDGRQCLACGDPQADEADAF